MHIFAAGIKLAYSCHRHEVVHEALKPPCKTSDAIPVRLPPCLEPALLLPHLQAPSLRACCVSRDRCESSMTWQSNSMAFVLLAVILTLDDISIDGSSREEQRVVASSHIQRLRKPVSPNLSAWDAWTCGRSVGDGLSSRGLACG